jgi:hypothetical protein
VFSSTRSTEFNRGDLKVPLTIKGGCKKKPVPAIKPERAFDYAPKRHDLAWIAVILCRARGWRGGIQSRRAPGCIKGVRNLFCTMNARAHAAPCGHHARTAPGWNRR